MDLVRFDAALRGFATSPGRRRAVHALGVASVGLLAMVGGRGHEDDVAAARRRWTRRGSRQGRGGPPPRPAALAPAEETPGDSRVAAEAKKGNPGPTGLTGPTGERGPIATSFETGAKLLSDSLFATAIVDAECPAGSEVIVGGFDTSVNGAQTGEVKVNSAVAIEADGNSPALYRVTFTRTGTAVDGDILVIAFAVCSP
jgi:hypothetical protein